MIGYCCHVLGPDGSRCRVSGSAPMPGAGVSVVAGSSGRVSATSNPSRPCFDSRGCRGWSLGVYNPDLDDDGRDAHAIVDMFTRVAGSINTRVAP
jgi:hypothetical protein